MAIRGARHTFRFLEGNQAGEFHPALSTKGLDYDPASGKWVVSGTLNIDDTANYHRDHFLRVMEEFGRRFPATSKGPDHTIRSSHNWQEVLVVAGEAADNYASKGKGFKHFFRNVGRRLGDCDLEPILSTVLPSGEYTSLVCGGLILIFKAFAKMSKVRHDVMTTLGDAPALLQDVDSILQMYPDDKRLEERATALYIALLVTVEAIIQWFDHTAKDWLKVIPQQGLYARSLDDKKAFLQRATQELKDQADFCDKNKTVEISNAIKLNLERSEQILDTTREGVARLGQLQESVEHFSVNVEGIIRDTVREEMQRMVSSSQTSSEAQKSIIESVLHTFVLESTTTQLSYTEELVNTKMKARDDEIAERERHAEEIERRASERVAYLTGQLAAKEEILTRATTPQRFFSSDEIVRILGDCHLDGISDANEFLLLARTYNPDSWLAHAVTSSPKFKHWFASPISLTLYVCPETEYAKTSPGSFVIASLYQAIAEKPPVIALAYFSSQRTSTNGGTATGAMMCSLLSQLLAAQNLDLTGWPGIFADRRRDYEALAAKELTYLRTLFELVVNMMTSGTIFLLIDDFSILEGAANHDQLRDTMLFFSMLVHSCSVSKRVTFKMLIMTPARGSAFVHCANRNDVLELAQDEADDDSDEGARGMEYELEFAHGDSSP